MTREEIAQNVRTLFDKYVSVLGEMSEILDEVSDEEIIIFGSTIKAIEAESCEDCISRSYVINELIKHQHSTEFCTEHHIDNSIDLGMATIVVNNAPSVTLVRKKENQWIKYDDDDSKTWPPDGTWVIWLHKRGGMQIIRWKNDAQNHFYPNDPGWEIEDVVAWMPLPDPYKEVKE